MGDAKGLHYRDTRRRSGRALRRHSRAAADAAREGAGHRAESPRRHLRIRSRLLGPGTGVPRGRRPRDPRRHRPGDGALARHGPQPPAGRGDDRRRRVLGHRETRSHRNPAHARRSARGDDSLLASDPAPRRAGRGPDRGRRRPQLPGPPIGRGGLLTAPRALRQPLRMVRNATPVRHADPDVRAYRPRSAQRPPLPLRARDEHLHRRVPARHVRAVPVRGHRRGRERPRVRGDLRGSPSGRAAP